MNFKKTSFTIIIITVIIFSQISNVFAISLIDETIDYTIHQGQKITDIVSIENLKGDSNILIKNSFDQKEIHLFDKYTNQYIYSYLFRNNNVYNIYLSKFKDENNKYKEAGFEKIPTLHVSNVQNHDWFIDQGYTGIYSGDNCGPSSTAMVLNWFNINSNATAKEARNKIRPNGGWWYTDDVERYLRNNNLNISTNYISGENNLINIIDNGNIAILCVNVDKISYEKSSSSRIGRFYNNVTGHFLVLTGYVKIGDDIYFEVYDSNTWGRKVNNKDIPLGKGRYLKSEELLKAMKIWWNYAIEIEAKKLTPEEISDLNTLPIGGIYKDEITGKYGIHSWSSVRTIDLRRFYKVNF